MTNLLRFRLVRPASAPAITAIVVLLALACAPVASPVPAASAADQATSAPTVPAPLLVATSAAPRVATRAERPIVATVGDAAAQQNCTFTLGFKALHDQIQDIVGDCVSAETHNPDNGDGLQQTTNGLLVWRKADNWTAFTNGATTWINGPQGLQSRPADDRFAWESADPPPTAQNPTPVPGGPEPGVPGAVTLNIPASLSDQKNFTVARQFNLPPGFEVSLFSAGLGAARFMAFSPQGDLYVSLPRLGKVWAMPDHDHDGVADEVITFAEGLKNPHGLAWHDGYLYIAAEDQVVRGRDDDGDMRADGLETVVPGIPSGQGHWTSTVVFGQDGKMYLSIGSSCNNCEESDPRRASIMRYNPDGSGGEQFARGLRNAVGLGWHPQTGELWVTVNGRDELGDDVPPEMITSVDPGSDFGWPRCHVGRIEDPELGFGGSCQGIVSPDVEIQAHTAPLGMEFYTAEAFPAEYRGLFVALHGSWNRSEEVGYKVILVHLDAAGGGRIYDFLTGSLEQGMWSRPVDIVQAPDGSLFISDDGAGAIYRVRYVGTP